MNSSFPNSNLRSFISKLQKELENPLPGLDAKLKMAPDMRQIEKHLVPREDARLGAVLILFFEKNGNVYFPLIQRPEYDGVHSGQVAFPGGKWEPSDESLIKTALRETEEEIGVDQGQITHIGELSDHYISASNFLVKPVLGYIDEKPTFIPDNKEVTQVLEIGWNRASDERVVGQTSVHVTSQLRISTPYYDLHNKIVWGATAMILSELISIMNRR